MSYSTEKPKGQTRGPLTNSQQETDIYQQAHELRNGSFSSQTMKWDIAPANLLTAALWNSEAEDPGKSC